MWMQSTQIDRSQKGLSHCFWLVLRFFHVPQTMVLYEGNL